MLHIKNLSRIFLIFCLVLYSLIYLNCSRKNKENLCSITTSFNDDADQYMCDPDYGKKKRECILSHLYRIQNADECLRIDPNNSNCRSERQNSYIYLNCCPDRPCL